MHRERTRTDADVDAAQVPRILQQSSEALVIADQYYCATVPVLAREADRGGLQGCVCRLPAHRVCRWDLC